MEDGTPVGFIPGCSETEQHDQNDYNRTQERVDENVGGREQENIHFRIRREKNVAGPDAFGGYGLAVPVSARKK
jgi:hypothetical protein